MAKKNSFQRKLLELLQRKRLTKTDDLMEKALSDISLDSETDTATKYKLQRTLKQLQKNNLIEVHPTVRSNFARLTNKGRRKLRTIELSGDNSLRPMSWDGQWRIVIVNISEKRKDERDAFRYLLKKANFVCIKNTVWVSPYPLEHLLENLKKDFGFTDEIMIILTSQVDSRTEAIFMDSTKN